MVLYAGGVGAVSWVRQVGRGLPPCCSDHVAIQGRLTPRLVIEYGLAVEAEGHSSPRILDDALSQHLLVVALDFAGLSLGDVERRGCARSVPVHCRTRVERIVGT